MAASKPSVAKRRRIKKLSDQPSCSTGTSPPVAAAVVTTAGSASWVPQNQEDLELQLTTMLLEKALYELRYELNLRPDWVRIPLRGILDLVAPA